MKNHKDKILYGVIAVLILTILFMQNIIYVRVIDNAIIFGITKEEYRQLSKIDNMTESELDAYSKKSLAEADELLADARARGLI